MSERPTFLNDIPQIEIPPYEKTKGYFATREGENGRESVWITQIGSPKLVVATGSERTNAVDEHTAESTGCGVAKHDWSSVKWKWQVNGNGEQRISTGKCPTTADIFR